MAELSGYSLSKPRMTFGVGTALAPAQSTKTTRHRTVRGLEMTQELQESVTVSKKKSNTFPSLLDWYVLWSTLAPSRRWTSSLVNLNIHVTVTVTSDSREKHHQFLGE